MLRGISPLISPELLKTLHEMGHGDELLLADAHFPAHTLGQRVLRADGLDISSLLAAIMPLLVLDGPGNPLGMMQTDSPEDLDPSVESDFLQAIRPHAGEVLSPARLDRATFYERGRSAFAVLVTGETRPYGNILLRKGVTPPQ